MKNQQLEFDLSNTSSLVLELTGNPWTDFGIVSFCAELRSTPFKCQLVLTPHEATLTMDAANLEKFEEWFNQRFMERWNKLFWLSRGAKILGGTKLSYDEHGYIDRDKSQIQTTEDDRARIKKEWKGSTIKDTFSLTQIRFNFVGIGNNADTFRTKQQQNIRDFIQDWQGREGKKVCEMSGRSCTKSKDLLQVVNPLRASIKTQKSEGFMGVLLSLKWVRFTICLASVLLLMKMFPLFMIPLKIQQS